MKTLAIIGTVFLAIVAIVTITVVDRLVGSGCSKVSEIATGNFMLQNYRDFKDLEASIAQVDAQITSMDAEIAGYKKDFANKPISDWPYDAREELARKESVKRGYVSQYNMLVGRYNALVSDATKKWTKGSEPQEVKPFLRIYTTK